MHQVEGCADQELLDAYSRGGEEAAFAEIVRRHSRWVFAAAYRQLRNRQSAEDAVQVVFVLLATKAKHMEQDVKLSGWLFNATQFTVKNFRRMDRRRAARELAAQRREIVAESAPDSEMAARLDEAVAKLPSKDRTAVLLRFYQEQSIEEVAQAMGVSQAAAEKRVQRTLATLRRLLGIRGEDAIGMLAGYGIAHCPVELNQVVCRVALAAKAGLPLPPGVAAGAKGTGSLMMITQLKMVVAISAAAVLVAAPVTMLAMQNTSHAAPAQDSAAAPPALSPAGEEARKLYSLKDDEVVKYLPQPFSPGRDEFIMDAQKPRNGRGGGGFGGGGFGNGNGLSAPTAAIVLWDEQDARVTAGYGGRRTALTVANAVRGIATRMDEEVIGDNDILNMTLPGDFVVRRGADQEKILAAMQKIISDRLNKPCIVKLADTPSEVYVLSGQWKFNAIDNADETQFVHLFDKDRNDQRGQGNGAAPPKAFAVVGISRFINAPVIIEATDLPQIIHFKTHYDVNPPDPAKVLDHVTQQTGLTWKKETRNTRKIIVEASKQQKQN
jgi:RNA polymerase sigma factor (sigma-70 family)